MPHSLVGKIVAVAWRSQTAVNSTRFSVHYGGTWTSLALTGQNGLITRLNYSVNSGDIMEIYHASGTLPNHIIFSFYLMNDVPSHYAEQLLQPFARN